MFTKRLNKYGGLRTMTLVPFQIQIIEKPVKPVNSKTLNKTVRHTH